MERLALFHLLRLPPVWRRLWLPLLGLALYTTLTLYLEQHLLQHDIEFPVGVHALVGVVLGFLVVFRTNTSYERWWEGRKLWGQLVNDTRNLALRVLQLKHVPYPDRQEFGRILAAFGPALRDHLRGEASVEKLDVPQPAQPVPHVPLYLAGLLYARFQGWGLEPVVWLFYDRQLGGLMDICGGCERILKTPLAASHVAFVRFCIFLYLMALPVGLDFGLWTFPCVMLVGYFLLGIEQVAEDIQNPFGREADDLQLDSLCVTLVNSVQAVFPKESENAEVR